jgi:hypothetical protein
MQEALLLLKREVSRMLSGRVFGETEFVPGLTELRYALR